MILAMVMCLVILLMTSMFIVIAHDQLVVGKVPFRRLKEETINEILLQLKWGRSDTFVDIGCGDGRVLVLASHLLPEANYIGLERAILPYLLAKYKTRKYKKICIMRKNALHYNLENSTVVFMFLTKDFLAKFMQHHKQIITQDRVLISVGFMTTDFATGKKHVLKHPSPFATSWYSINL